MKFGISKEIITPVIPTKLACLGNFDEYFSYIHDDVYVRCVVLDDGSEKAILMSFDLLFHDRSLNDEIASYAEEKYGVKKSAVVVACTHAHTAPAVRGYNPGHHSDEYEEFLLARAKSCIDRAMCSMFSGRLEYGVFDAEFNISRRGNVNGVFDNLPDFEYQRDTEMWAMCIRDLSGNIRSIIVNYACHPVFYPAKDSVSGEFPARLCQLLDAKYYGCTAMYFQSAAGDVRPRATLDEELLKEGKYGWRYDLTFDDISKTAQNMCDAICEFIESGKLKEEELSIASDEFETELEMEQKPLEYFIQQRKELEGLKGNPSYVNACLITDGGYEKLPKSMRLRCQTVKLSDTLYIATVGGEPCFGVKFAVKSAFEGKDVLFIGYTDACAYIVCDKILEEGGYEPNSYLEYGHIGPFKKGLDEKYRKSFEESLKRIK